MYHFTYTYQYTISVSIHIHYSPTRRGSLGKLMSEKIETCNYLARLTGTFNQSVSKSVFKKAILLLMKFVSEVGKSSLLRPYSVQDGSTHYTIDYTGLEYCIMVWNAIFLLYFILKLIFLKVIYKSWKSSTRPLQFRKFDFELSFFLRKEDRRGWSWSEPVIHFIVV